MLTKTLLIRDRKRKIPKAILKKTKEPEKQLKEYYIYRNPYGTKVVFFSEAYGPTLSMFNSDRITNIESEFWKANMDKKILRAIGSVHNSYIIKPEDVEAFISTGINIAAVSRSTEELREDIALTKTKIVLCDKETLMANEDQISRMKKELSLQIIEVCKQAAYMNRLSFEMIKGEEKERHYLADKHVERPAEDSYKSLVNFGANLTKSIQELESHKEDGLNNYLEEIFPNIPVELISKVSTLVHLEFNKILKYHQKTYSGNVGKIYFEIGNKNYFFKVYPPEKKKNARIEFEIGKKIEEDKILKGLCVSTVSSPKQKTPLVYEGYSLILTEDVTNKPHAYNNTEMHLMTQLSAKIRMNINDEIFHKIFVIAAVHSRLKRLVDKARVEEIIQRTDFFSWDVMEEMMLRTNKELKSYLPDLKEIYKDVVEKHGEIKTSVIGHNDPKWDNFVNGYLIDFGSVHSTTPYVDISRVLVLRALDTNYSLDPYIFAYVFFRHNLDDSFNLAREIEHPHNNIFINTYERIFIESIRIGKFKATVADAESANIFFWLALVISYKIKKKVFMSYLDAIKLNISTLVDTRSVGNWKEILSKR